MGARRILHYGHSSQIHYVKRRDDYSATQLLRFRGRLIGAIDGDIDHPVRRHSIRSLILPKRVAGCRVPAFQFEKRIHFVWTNRRVLWAPTKQRTIKSLGGCLIGRAEFNPAERSSGML